MWPFIILGGLGVGLYVYANRDVVSREGPPDTKCKLSGEEFQAALTRITGGYKPTVDAVMATYGNPMAKKAELMKLAATFRIGNTVDGNAIADCIEVQAGKATNP